MPEARAPSRASFDGYSTVSVRVVLPPCSVRTIVARMCDDLRIYNPAAHSIRVEA